MILAACQHVDRNVDLGEVDGNVALDRLSGNAQVVLEISIAHVPAVHRTRQVGAVGVPEENVKRVRLPPFKIVANDVGPDQVVSTQCREDESKLAGWHDAALSDGLLPGEDAALVNQQPNLAGLGKIEHGREKRQALDLVLAARGQHCRRAAEHGPTDAKAECVDLVGARHCEGHIDRA